MNKKEIGKKGELLAQQYVKTLGFSILSSNWTCRWGEIDLIAEKDHTLTFIEVKYRTNLNNGHPSQSLDYYKRKSLQRSINIYLSKNYVCTPWKIALICVSEFNKLIKIDFYDCISLI